MNENYIIQITESDLRNNGIVSNNEERIKQLLAYTHLVFYDFIVYASKKEWRKKIIQKHKAKLEGDIKHILGVIAWSIDKHGDYIGLDNGYIIKNDESVEVKSLQERLISVIPTVAWNLIGGLEPNITFTGGKI